MKNFLAAFAVVVTLPVIAGACGASSSYHTSTAALKAKPAKSHSFVVPNDYSVEGSCHAVSCPLTNFGDSSTLPAGYKLVKNSTLAPRASSAVNVGPPVDLSLPATVAFDGLVTKTLTEGTLGITISPPPATPTVTAAMSTSGEAAAASAIKAECKNEGSLCNPALTMQTWLADVTDPNQGTAAVSGGPVTPWINNSLMWVVMQTGAVCASLGGPFPGEAETSPDAIDEPCDTMMFVDAATDYPVYEVTGPLATPS